jgi:hypothetical protein
MQGRVFLGNYAEAPRDYIFASRDRYDESYDMIRAARDRRFKYIRNYYPQSPYLLWIPYRNRHPILQEMWRCYLEGSLSDEQLLMFQGKRPVEELYDTETDPWETKNVAEDPQYREDLRRLRRALDDWRDDVGDLGTVPELEMVRRWYPDGKQPVTAKPVFVPITADGPGVTPAQSGGTFEGPMLLQLYCATQGASIAYAIDEDPSDRWRLYTEPLRLGPGRHTVRAKAVRIGYAESGEVHATFAV